MEFILAKIQFQVHLHEHTRSSVLRPAKQALENAAPLWGRARFRPSNLFSAIGAKDRIPGREKVTKILQRRQRGGQQQRRNRHLIVRT
ncbi:MAG: hypothetical protein CMO28_26225 [Tistrella sp.]|nr:hypothetical protein [Tistrella sp.]